MPLATKEKYRETAKLGRYFELSFTCVTFFSHIYHLDTLFFKITIR